uniref:Tyrosyl-DNA phosphodiesterase 2 n=1 Tax=Ciona savignyi TaxID=51511 RepID=H2ZAM5_CIOSA
MADKISEFIAFTGTESRQLAEYYLQITSMNVEHAINLFLEDSTEAEGSTDTQSKFSILEWNIQGLLPDYLKERTVAVVEEITRLQPDVVMLQEVIMTTFVYIQAALSDYDVICPFMLDESANASYFVAMLVRKSSFQVYNQSLICFPTSTQGRNVIKVSGKCCGSSITIMTSHLESTKEKSNERVKQLVQICDVMMECQSENVVFGADTNLRDSEVTRAKRNSESTSKISDIWEFLGSDERTRYLWDLTLNDNQIKGGNARLRFERLLMRDNSGNHGNLTPVSMETIGTNRLPCGLFPSDHWGALVTFKKH